MTTMRAHTRVAHMMDAASQPDPWDVNLNHNPASPDKRLGDGTYRGPPEYAASILRAYPDTTNSGGVDFVGGSTKEGCNKKGGGWVPRGLWGGGGGSPAPRRGNTPGGTQNGR